HFCFKKGKSPRNDNLFSIKNGRAQHKTTRYIQITIRSTTTITPGAAKKPVKHYSTSAGGLFLSGLSLSDNMMCEVRTRHTAAFNIRVLGRTP
ncbi:hypothetical protein RQL77_26620, partial [Citrobacter braakii]|uniref:hypothetical protein n=1 Tax=Citrobacter braakii TaxID=57706 RepID=UPI0028BD832F